MKDTNYFGKDLTNFTKRLKACGAADYSPEVLRTAGVIVNQLRHNLTLDAKLLGVFRGTGEAEANAIALRCYADALSLVSNYFHEAATFAEEAAGGTTGEPA